MSIEDDNHSQGQQPGRRQDHGRRRGQGQVERNEFDRGLTSRHVQFIAIGGAIGTGLFLGSGKSIAMTGPSIILQYIAVGLVIFIFMRAMGELMFADPSQHTFINPIRRYLGAPVGFFAGWSYWVVLVIIGMGEITAVAQYCVTFFGTFNIDLRGWEWLIELVFLIILVMVNLIAVKVFGEAEFWFSMIKITLIVGVILTGIVMVAIHFHYPAAHFPGSHPTPAASAALTNITDGLSLAPKGWLRFLLGFQMVFFSYTLIESIGVTVSEMEEPRKMLPKATNQLIYRILIFYVGALLAIMAIVPWTDFVPNADGSFDSPFVMVFRFAGIDWASGLVFFVVITAASSALNSMLFSAGRQLFQFSSDAVSAGRLRAVAGSLDSAAGSSVSTSSAASATSAAVATGSATATADSAGSVSAVSSVDDSTAPAPADRLPLSARLLRPFTKVSSTKVPRNAIIASAVLILLAPILESIPGMSNLFTIFTSAASAIIIVIYSLTIVAHWKYRHSADFLPDGFLLRGYRVWDSLAIVFFVFVYATLFLAADTRTPAIFGLVWLVGFGLVSWLVNRRPKVSQPAGRD